ncbi:hypothetical protein HA075_04260 [bacterium BFN5]|nr:hypothetical protein HA075_04175 [bacterium BFN5]QJW45133.1 hypothetical protein HA075_04260 [bacterium BFN5]
MNKNKKWLIAASIATMIAANGLVMAATPAQQNDTRIGGAQHAFANKGDFAQQGKMRGFYGDDSKLLELLKLDAETLRTEIRAGKTLVAIAQEQGVSEQTLQEFMVKELTHRIDDGVKAGRLTAEQAENMKKDMDKNVSDMINGKMPMHGHGPMRGLADNTKLLALLKIDAQTLKTEMKAGKTLVTIAEEHGVSEKSLKSFMVKDMTQRIDEGVKAGRLSEDQAKSMKKNLDKRVSDMINGKGPMHGPMHGPGFFHDENLLALLKTDAETLKTELKAGKTLVEIAQAQGVSEQTLKSYMMERMTDRINEGVKSGRLTAEKAQKMKANLDNRVSDMINGKGFPHAYRGASQG